MFDQERAITAWRRRLAVTGSLAKSDLDELESHLRDELDALAEVGITGEDAFQAAVVRLGDPDALGEEYARGNPAEAWRAPLLWCVIGCLATFVTWPLLERVWLDTAVLGLELQLSPTMIRRLVMASMLGAQLLFFAGLFACSHRSSTSTPPLGWAESPRLRVGALVACAFIPTVGNTTSSFVLQLFYGHLRNPGYDAAICAELDMSSVRLYALPFAMCLLALRHRKAMTPVGWLAVGCLAAVVLRELSYLVFAVALRGALFGRLESARMQLVAWVAMLGWPALYLVAASRLTRMLPSPRVLARGRAFVLLIAAACVLGIAPQLFLEWLGPLDGRMAAPGGTAVHETYQAFLFMDVVITSAFPVALGAIMLRLRNGLRERECAGSR